MAIEFHCEHCGKLVRTSEDNAGKRGKCPGCHQSVYIPTPDEQLETLDIAPIDEDDERERQKLEKESRNVAQNLMADRETPPESAGRKQPAAKPATDARLARDQVQQLVIDYCKAMAAGDLTKAQTLSERVGQNMSTAEPIIDQIMSDEIPPDELSETPRPVLNGFLKQLREQK